MTDDAEDLEPIDLAADRPPPDEPRFERWPEGWYADPWTAGQYRYWNGHTWTGATHRWGPANLGPGAAAGAWPAAGGVTRGYGVPSVAPAGPPPQPPSRHRGPAVAVVIALVAVLVASGIIGYAINANSQPNRAVNVTPPTSTPPTPTTPSTTTPPIVSRDPDRNVLSGFSVRQADVGTGRTVLLYQNGNSLGDPTLDLCNGKYPSERLRTARLQLVDVDANGVSSLSTEAVLYRSPKATAQAFGELTRDRNACPDKPVTSPVDGTKETTRFQAAPDATWPAAPASIERQAYRMTIAAQGQSSELVTVYLRRGRALLGLYFPQPDGRQPAVAGRSTIADIVALFEARMEKLPVSVVNGRVKTT